jgi:indolepyruvate ferredoxin oxidoreductase
VLKLLAKAKMLRGSKLDLFGYAAERQLERKMIADFENQIGYLCEHLTKEKLAIAIEIARLPQTVRGYGHVKLRQYQLAKVREAELLHRLNPKENAAPKASLQAGQIRGIEIVRSTN